MSKKAHGKQELCLNKLTAASVTHKLQSLTSVLLPAMRFRQKCKKNPKLWRQHRGAWRAVVPAQSDVSADIQGRLTQLDRDLSDSWFGYRRGGLKGHTIALPLSRSSVPHSEQSASERLEQQRKQRNSFNHAHTDADEWQQKWQNVDVKKTDTKWHTPRHIKGGGVREQNTKQHIKVFVSWGWGSFVPLQAFFSPSWGDIYLPSENETPLTSVCSLLCMLRNTIDAWELHLHSHW